MEDMNDDVAEVRPVTPTNWALFTAISLAVPIVPPGSHPNHPGTIWGPPINHIGLSGIGKSQRLKQIARSVGLPGVHVVFTSTKQPNSFEGALVPTSNGVVIECTLPAARKCIQNGGGFIFFDEVNGASPRTQNAMLSTLSDRQFGDHVVPPGTRMQCAMNPLERSAGGFVLSAPMANRMGHVNYPTPSAAEWGDYVNGVQEHVPLLLDCEGRVRTGWDDSWRITNALLQGFIRNVPSSVFVNQPEADSPHSSGAWPSYRTWYWALCAITTCRILLDKKTQDTQAAEFVHALCGEATAAQWVKWLVDADLPDPADMLHHGWTPDEIRVDRSYAALNSMTDYVINIAKSDRATGIALAEKSWRILERALNTSVADLTATCASKLHNAKLGRQDTNAATAAAAGDVIYRLTQAGYTKLAST